MTARLLQSAWRFSRNELSGKPGAVQYVPASILLNFGALHPDDGPVWCHLVDVPCRGGVGTHEALLCRGDPYGPTRPIFGSASPCVLRA
jgi:hypothetical protein